jgi:hypothetical protein
MFGNKLVNFTMMALPTELVAVDAKVIQDFIALVGQTR